MRICAILRFRACNFSRRNDVVSAMQQTTRRYYVHSLAVSAFLLRLQACCKCSANRKVYLGVMLKT